MTRAPDGSSSDGSGGENGSGENGGGENGGGLDWLRSAAATLRARWWVVALAALVAGLAAVAYLRTADYRYTAALRVAPAPTSARESASLGALTSLASLTGATLDAIPVTPFRLYVEGVFTREVAIRLARDPALMRHVFADEWDPRTRRWHAPDAAGYRWTRSLYAFVGAPLPAWSRPDAARLQAWIGERVHLDQTPKTPIVTISVDDTDPAFARRLLPVLHRTVDSWLRERTLDRTANNIAYINAKLPTVALADHRQALFATLSDQEQRQMTARNPAAYAAERFGDVTVSPVPTSPRQLVLLAAALALGLALGVAAALLVPRRGGAFQP